MSSATADTLRSGRDAYLRSNGLPADGGYDDAWVKLKLGPLPFAFPNTKARKRDVPLHDLHHVLTGYGTDLVGEAEIGAWEVASGCRGAALHLNLRVMGVVVLTAPGRLFRAFVRGRHSDNLYGRPCTEELLETPAETMRGALRLDGAVPRASVGDWSAFALWVSAAIAIDWGPLPLLVWAWYAWS